MSDLVYAIRGVLISIPIAYHLNLMPGAWLNYLVMVALAGFFYLSGAFFMPRTLKYTAKLLILPMFAVSLIVNWIIPGFSNLELLKGAILACIIPIGISLWFIWALVIFWGLATMFYESRILLLFSSVLAFLLLHPITSGLLYFGINNPFQSLVIYGLPFMLGLNTSSGFRLLIKTISNYKNPFPNVVSSWLVSLGKNSKWVYLAFPYSSSGQIAYPLSVLVLFGWLFSSNLVITYSKSVLNIW